MAVSLETGVLCVGMLLLFLCLRVYVVMRRMVGCIVYPGDVVGVGGCECMYDGDEDGWSYLWSQGCTTFVCTSERMMVMRRGGRISGDRCVRR